ncbi:hypothetical protein [Sphingomonas sp.]|uniref:hypothetical protein n=1 Tax=Sphingomonas sp. TaxID=28214 RepID=UPI002DD6A373|nr:hypothetical protein [Sphingomonas sp.]
MYAYLDRPVTSLDRGAAFLLWAIRTCTTAIIGRRCLGIALGPGFGSHGAEGALPSFAVAMAVLVREANRTIEIMPARCCRVGEDEAILLSLLGATDDGADARVRAVVEMLVDDDGARVAAFRAARTLAIELLAAGLAPATFEGTHRP